MKDKAVSKTDDTRHIRLALNFDLNKNICAVCGEEWEPRGFDFFDAKTGKLICDCCAEKLDQEQSDIQWEAFTLVKFQTSLVRHDIRNKILAVINEPAARIRKLLDDICNRKTALNHESNKDPSHGHRA